MRSVIFFALLSVSCSNNLQTIGIYNNKKEEIQIETKPNIDYGGGLEKFIGIDKDTTGRGLVWIVGEIDAIIVYPNPANFERDTLGVYIMKPKSGFEIGSFYKPVDKAFDSKCLHLDYLKIVTSTDTLILDTREKIWNALNYDKRKDKKIKATNHEWAIVLNE